MELCSLKLSEENIWTEKNEMVGGWRKLQIEELLNLYSWASVIKTIVSTRMVAGHVARMGKKTISYRFGVKHRRKEVTKKT
jgi:hypothetical protein